ILGTSVPRSQMALQIVHAIRNPLSLFPEGVWMVRSHCSIADLFLKFDATVASMLVNAAEDFLLGSRHVPVPQDFVAPKGRAANASLIATSTCTLRGQLWGQKRT